MYLSYNALSVGYPEIVCLFLASISSDVKKYSKSSIVVTADNGTDQINFIDIGIAGSTYDDTTPNAYPTTKPNDGYLYLVGNPSAGFGGNLVIGTAGSGSHADISFVQGTGYTETARFVNGQGLVIETGTASSSNNTGALVVEGGVGVQGSVYADALYDNGVRITVGASDAYAKANGAFDKANTANVLAQAAYDSGNTTLTYAQSGYAKANAANNLAQAAYDNSNTKFNSSGGTISGDTTVTGNLTVTGTTFYANTKNVLIEDNIVTLNSNVSGTPSLNAGIEVNRGNQTNTSFIWNETNKDWEFTNDGTTYKVVGDAANITSTLTYATAGFNQANLANVLAQAAFDKANSANVLAQNAYDSGNTTLTYATAGFNKANLANVLAQAAYDSGNSTLTYATAGFNKANTANVTAQAAFDFANSVNTYAFSAYAQGNSTLTYATAGFNKANTANVTAQAAFDFANSVNTYASAAYANGNNTLQFAQAGFNKANTANVTAQAAFDFANSVNTYARSAYASSNTKATVYNTSSAPTSAQVDDIWIDPNSGIEYVNISSNSAVQWVEFGPLGTPQNVTANLQFADQTIFNTNGNKDIVIQSTGTGNIVLIAANTIVANLLPSTPTATLGTQSQPFANVWVSNASIHMAGNGTTSSQPVIISNDANNVVISTGGLKLTGGVLQANSVFGTSHLYSLNVESDFIVANSTFGSNESLVNITGSRYGAQPPLNPGYVLHVTGQDGQASRIVNDAFGTGNYPLIALRAARGTAGTPTAVQTGDLIARYSGNAFDGTSYASSGVARIDMYATENHTTSNKGSKIVFGTMLTGSNVFYNVATFDGQAGVTFAANVTSNIYVYSSNTANAGVTQSSSKSTSVTANGASGVITMNNAKLNHQTSVTFTVNNSFVLHTTDVPIVAIQNPVTSGLYQASVGAVRVGSFDVIVFNTGAGPGQDSSDAIVINFAIIRVGT